MSLIRWTADVYVSRPMSDGTMARHVLCAPKSLGNVDPGQQLLVDSLGEQGGRSVGYQTGGRDYVTCSPRQRNGGETHRLRTIRIYATRCTGSHVHNSRKAVRQHFCCTKDRVAVGQVKAVGEP